MTNADPIRILQRAGQFSYRVRRQLGVGGMGAVYEAERASDRRPVAIKVIQPRIAVNEKMRALFEREIANMLSLDHPRMAAMYEHGAVDSVFYIVMELCPGGSVDKLLERRRGKLSVPESIAIALDALEGLAYAHRRGFVHRDLKPHNILLGADGRAKVADLGLAKSAAAAGLSGVTQTGECQGTAPFMPREQMINFKYVKPSADVWSMGSTLYNMLTGCYPREAPPGSDWRRAVLDGACVPLRERDASIPATIAAVVDWALERDPEKRPPTAQELRRALAEAAREVR